MNRCTTICRVLFLAALWPSVAFAEPTAEDAAPEEALVDATDGGLSDEDDSFEDEVLFDDELALDDEDLFDDEILLDSVEFGREAAQEEIRRDLMHQRAERTSQHLRVDNESFQSARDLGDLLQRSTEYAPSGNQMPMPSIEGLSGAHVDVLIDGLPAASRIQTRNGPAVDLSMIPIDPSDVERIDIYQGIGPAGSGDGSGVILDIITRDDLEPGFSVRAETVFGDEGFHGYDFRGSVRLRPSDDVLFSSGVHAQFTPSFDADDDGILDSTREHTFSAQNSMRWRRGDDEQTLVAADFTTRSTELPSPTGTPNLIDRYQIRVRARNTSPLPEGWTLDSSLSFGLLSDEYTKAPDDESPPEIVSDNRVADGTGALYFKRAFGPVDLGMELCGNGQGVNLIDSDGAATDHSEGQVCAASSAHWWASDNFDVNARALAAYHSEFGFRGVGGLTVTGRPSDQWVLRASADYTERVPTSEERYQLFLGYIVLEGNPDLQPEQTTSVRGAVSYATPSDSFGIEVSGFGHFQRERVEPKLVATAATSEYGQAVYQYVNVAQARTAGVRAEVRAAATNAGLELIARYTWLPVLQNVTSGDTLELQSRHAFLGILEGEWLDKRLQAWTSLGLRSGQTWTGGPIGAPPQGARPIWNVGVAGQVHESIQLRAEATNLLDKTDPYWGPYAGWEVRTSVRFDLYYDKSETAAH